MKRKFNLIALVILVSVNVLTPITYAWEILGALPEVFDDADSLLIEENLEAEEPQVLEGVELEVTENEDVETLEEEEVVEEISDEEFEEVSALSVLEKSVQDFRGVAAGVVPSTGDDDSGEETCGESEFSYTIDGSDSSDDSGSDSLLPKSVATTYYCAKELTDYLDVNGVVVPLLDRNLGAKNVGDTGFYYLPGRTNGNHKYCDSELYYCTGDTAGQQIHSDWGTGDKGPCPTGYHVPTIAEWSAFIVARCEAEDVCDFKQLEQKNYRSSDLKYSWEISGELGNNKSEIIEALTKNFPIVGAADRGGLKENRMDQSIYWASDPVTQTNHSNQPHEKEDMENENGESNPPADPRDDSQAWGFYFSNHVKKGGWAGLHESDIYEYNQVRCIADDYTAPTLLAIDVYLGDEEGTDTSDSMDNEDWKKREFVDKSSSLTKDSILSGVIVADIDGYNLVWYDASGTKIDFNGLNGDYLEDVSDLKVIGMYEPKEGIEYNPGNITYIDTNGKVFSGIGTITITYGTSSITMLDRNLGATSTDIDSLDSHGYHFQWGNNYGFTRVENDSTGFELSENVYIGIVDTSGYSRNNPYVSGTFIQQEDWNYGDWSNPRNDDLWGGDGDYDNNGGNSSADYKRQGPCPAGFHVPSQSELNLLGDMYYYVGGYENDGSIYYNSYGHVLYGETFERNFLQDLKIPLAGYRNFGDAKVREIGENATLWSSSPSSNYDGLPYSASMNIDIDYAMYLGMSEHRGVAESIRCFQDADIEGQNIVVLSYDTRGGTAIQAQTLAEGMTGYMPGYTSHKTGAELLGRYYEDLVTPFDLENTNLTADTTIYARWSDDYVVTFKDYDGSVIKVVLVKSGLAAKAPADPTRDGYKFTGWDKDLNNVSEDMEVIAQYSSLSKGGYSGGGGSSSSKSIKSQNSEDEADKTVSNDEKSKGDNDEPKKEVVQPIQGKTLDADTSSKETFNAHQWAYSKGLTKYRTPTEARMDDPLNRSEMAKISSIFAEQFLDKLPNDKKQEFCSQYPDLWKVEDDMKFFIIESCKLGYMGYESNGVDALAKFRPYTPVTVAEAATILSRIVWGNDNAMNGKDWYKGHLYATYNHGLIDDIKDPTKRSITRREAYLMLYRLTKFL